jgi:hypothetical protein
MCSFVSPTRARVSSIRSPRAWASARCRPADEPPGQRGGQQSGDLVPVAVRAQVVGDGVEQGADHLDGRT